MTSVDRVRSVARNVWLAIGGLAFVAGCAARLPGLQGREMYLCCNLWFDRDGAADDAGYIYSDSTMLPFGTQVRILDSSGRSVKFSAADHSRQYVLKYRYGVGAMSPVQYFGHVFVDENPKAQMGEAPQGILDAIKEGKLIEGMTKQQVIMARGYPPFHRTASVASDEWLFFPNRADVYRVRFSGNVVSAVERVEEATVKSK